MVSRSLGLVVFLLFLVCDMYSAQKTIKLYEPSNEKCLSVARYLQLTQGKVDDAEQARRKEFLSRNHPAVQKVKNYLHAIDSDMDKAIAFLNGIPRVKACDLVSTTAKLDDNVYLMGQLLSRSNMIMFVTFRSDVFTTICDNHLPEFFEDRAGFFNPEFNDGIQKVERQFEFAGNLNSSDKQIPKKNKTVSKQEMIKGLEQMPFGKVLYVLNYVTQPYSPSSGGGFEFVVDDTTSIAKGCVPVNMNALEYYWTYEDCVNFTPEQRNILDEIVKKSNEADRHLDSQKLFVITDDVIATMKLKKNNKSVSLKDFILGNEKFHNARIAVDISSSSSQEKLRNKFLYWIPHLLVMIIPDFVQSQISGVSKSAAGLLGSCAVSFIFGEYVYPRIDAYNSDVYELSKFFGKNNHAKKRAGLDFAWISILHSECNLIAQKLLSCQPIPWKILGGALYVFRAFRACVDLKRMEFVANRDPFQRRNKGGTYFKLKDLVVGPKFAEQK